MSRSTDAENDHQVTVRNPTPSVTSSSDRNGLKRSGRPKRLARRITKKTTIEKLLARKSGATTAQLISATGWQAHSVRAALSRLRKTGVVVDRTENKKGTTIYRTMARS